MKKTTIYLIMIIVFFLTLIIAVAYATITSVIHANNKANIYTYVGNKLTLTVISEGGFDDDNNSPIDFEFMQQGSSNEVVEFTRANMNVVLTSDVYQSGCCTYDIIWEWNSTNVVKNRYIKTTGATDEYVLVGYQNDTAYYYKGQSVPTVSTTMSPVITFSTQLPNYNASSLSTVVYSGQICNKSNLSDNVAYNVNQYWRFKTYFYNLTLNQDAFQGASFAGKVRIGNVSCTPGTFYNYPTTKVYWYDTNTYYPGRTPATTYTSGAATGHSVYVMSESLTHSACATIQGHEVCLSQPYTQYGLSGHTAGNNFTTAQKESVKQALYQTLIDSGITINIGNCNVTTSQVTCIISDVENSKFFNCSLNKSGSIWVSDVTGSTNYSEVDINGNAKCRQLS